MAAREALAAETPESVVMEMSQHMEELARDGEWVDVENMAVRLRGAVMNVPEARRREVLQDVHRVTEKIRAEAETAHRDLADRLSGLRRGQVATRAYKAG